jgi:uncharacterized membrane protein YhiD involved in acid resistance
MFASLAAGIACGVSGYSIAIVGTLVFCLIAFVLYASPFGKSSFFDGMLRFNTDNETDEKTKIGEILNKHCRTFALVTLRDLAQGKRLDYAYHVKFRKGRRKEDLIADLNHIASIQGLSLMMQETTVEL